MSITLEVVGADEVARKLGAAYIKFPSYAEAANKETAREIAKSIRSSANFSEASSGRLKRSIKSTKVSSSRSKSEYGIRMKGYGPIVETGRGRGKIPPMSNEIVQWVSKAWGSSGLMSKVYYFRQRFHTKRSKAKPFIRPGIATAKPKIQRIIIKYIRRGLK